MRKSMRQTLIENWPVIRGWLIALCFIGLAGDFSSLNRIDEGRIFPGTPEFDEAMRQHDEVLAELQTLHHDGTLTLKRGAEIQVLLVYFSDRMDTDWREQIKSACLLSEEVYVKNWIPSASISRHIKDEQMRAIWAESEFMKDWCVVQSVAREKYYQPLTSSDVMRVLLWLLKWYFLLTIPVFLIVLLNKRSAGSSIKEELLLQPQRWLLTSLAGPVGLMVISETAAKVARYERLERQLLASKPLGTWLTADERAALWRQVEEPLLAFDEAMTLVNAGMAPKPLLACAIVWVLSINICTAAKSVRASEQIVCSAADWLESGQAKVMFKTSGMNLLLAAILPVAAEVVMSEGVLRFRTTRDQLRPSVRLESRPRGPPAAVKEPFRENESLTLGCIKQKRVGL